MTGSETFVNAKLHQRKVMLFSKTGSPDCKFLKKILAKYNMAHGDYEAVEIEKRQDCTQIENYFQILCLTDSREVPQLFIRGKHVGGYLHIVHLHQTGELRKKLKLANALPSR